MFVHVTDSEKVSSTRIQPKRKHFTSRSTEKLKKFTVPTYKKSMSKIPTISSFIKEKRQKSCMQLNKTSDITVFITENGDKSEEQNKQIVDTLLENIITNDTLNLSNWNPSEKSIELWEILKVFEIKEYAIELLDVSQSGINELPSSIMHIKNLKTLILSNNNLYSIPKELGIYQHLKYINLNYNNLSELSIYVQSLEVLKVNSNKISNVSDILFTCQKLQILEVSHNSLRGIPESINYLENLRIIDLSYNSLNTLPFQMSKLKNLLRINLNNNMLVKIPSLKDIRLLEYLNINNNKINSLPEMCSYGCMKEIHANKNNIDNLDENILCMLTSLEVLEVSGNKLSSIPLEIKKIKTLKYLNVSHNNIHKLPEDLMLKNLHISFDNQNLNDENDLIINCNNLPNTCTANLKYKENSVKSSDMATTETECEDEVFKTNCKGPSNITSPRKAVHYQPAINFFMRSNVFDSSCEDIHIIKAPIKKVSAGMKKAQEQKAKNFCPNCSPRFEEPHFGYVYQPIPMFYYHPFSIQNLEQGYAKRVAHSKVYKQTKRSRKSYAEPKIYISNNKKKFLNKNLFTQIYSKRLKEDEPQCESKALEMKQDEYFGTFYFPENEKHILPETANHLSSVETVLNNTLSYVPHKLPHTEKEGPINTVDMENVPDNEKSVVKVHSTTKECCEDTHQNSLHILDFSMTNIDFISDDVFKEAARLNKQKVNLEKNSLTACPIGIILMKEKLTELNLSHNNLYHVQQYLGDLINIEILNLSYNRVGNLPKTLKRCKKLRDLAISHNMLCFVPSVIYEIESLRVLNLSNNMIDEIEKDCMSNLKHLETLDLAYNHITVLPPDINKLQNLNNINLVGNNIRHFTESDLLKNGKEILNLISVKMRNV